MSFGQGWFKMAPPRKRKKCSPKSNYPSNNSVVANRTKVERL